MLCLARSTEGDDEPALLLNGMLTNARGQVVASTYSSCAIPTRTIPTFTLPQPVGSLGAALDVLGVGGITVNTGALAGMTGLDAYVPPGVRAAEAMLDHVFEVAAATVDQRVESWTTRLDEWEHDAGELVQRHEVRQRRKVVADELGIARSMRPDQRTVRPLLLVIPAGPS